MKELTDRVAVVTGAAGAVSAGQWRNRWGIVEELFYVVTHDYNKAIDIYKREYVFIHLSF